MFVLSISVCLIAGSALAAEAPSRAEELFAHRVLPLLKQKCFACHGEDEADVRGELNMLSREGLLKGGESGEPALKPGTPDESPLFAAANRMSQQWSAMPPKENDKLTAEELEHLKQWIVGGAPWPGPQRLAEIVRASNDKWNAADGVTVATSGGLADEWTNRRYKSENLWAYRAVRKDEGGRMKDEADHPIDAFIQRRLVEMGVPAAPPADRRTLIRRATFDLTGLPPSPAEIDAFLDDTASDADAFAKVVERLLASPHYGEQWGRHWLDVVRYADSSGYANDYERGNAWRYRDYVVRAFNQNKPYDQFIREQIAGDELIESTQPNGVSQALHPSSFILQPSEALIAAGFLRMGPWELTGMEVAKVARQRFLDDVTDAVGQVFLAHMLQCARCHDHKFDPVPTRDYYSIQAVFATTQLAEREAPFLPGENTGGFEEKKYLQQRSAYYQQVLREVNKKSTLQAARQWLAEQGRDAGPFEKAVSDLESRTPGDDVRLQAVRSLLAERKVHPDLIPPPKVGFTPQDYGLERVARKGLERLKWRLERYEPVALSVYDGRTLSPRSVNAPLRMPANRLEAGELEETCILAGGDPFSPTQPVQPGVLSVVGPRDALADPSKISGRRLALANWIASPENPLTARVMVNRIWQWHFGQAIAGNPNNFGATGKKPTHPELLDWLAARFIDSGWSVKQMHRLIMSSDAYRRSSQHPQPQMLAEQDPMGTSYAVFRPQRLDAEELRDAMLWASGELNPALGGIPVRPEMNLEAALQPRQVMGTFAEAWQPSALPSQRHRRSLYALRLRGQRDPFQEVFNVPSADQSCEARETSTITPQVFAMFNSEASFDRALALASRVLREAAKTPAAGTGRGMVIDRVFQLALGRPATPAEIESCLAHWQKLTARHETLAFDPPAYPRQVVREAVEENTGEKFTFVEPLEVYEDFVPDLKPADVGPNVRGLAEVCLVLFNSNEFAYVY
jgi:hypothetical protein